MITELLESDVIEKADAEVEYCSRSMFIPKACGTKLKLVMDYRAVNKLLKCPRTAFSTTEQIRTNLCGESRIFCTIDLSSGYHQVELSEEDCRIMTFLTPFGRFCFKRLPMGLSPS